MHSTVIHVQRPEPEEPDDGSALDLYFSFFDRCRQRSQSRSHEASPAAQPLLVRTTIDAINLLLRLKRHEGRSEATLETYRTKLAPFARRFPDPPTTLDEVLGYLDQFTNPTTRRNRLSLIKLLYKTTRIEPDPVATLKSPQVRKKAPRTLSLEQVRALETTPQTATERVALDLMLGHGWRQAEVRRVLAEDVRGIHDGLMWCRGKERDEDTPIVPETQQRLEVLAEGLSDGEPIIRGQRGKLGVGGAKGLWRRLYRRAGIRGYTGHDLRRTFATLVRRSGGDEFMAMRLLRDKIPGQSPSYIGVSAEELRRALFLHSPLTQVRQLGLEPAFPGPVDVLIAEELDKILRPAGNAIINDDTDLGDFLDRISALGQTAARLREKLRRNGHQKEQEAEKHLPRVA